MKILGVKLKNFESDLYVKNEGFYHVTSKHDKVYGFETRVYKTDENHKYEASDEVYARWYDDLDEMAEGHYEICDNLFDFII